uniref:ACB domain-containing protein n=1 Tax=Theropithecus gelada TaxID=9565 RepID=A0A8D2FMT1_THEGE
MKDQIIIKEFWIKNNHYSFKCVAELSEREEGSARTEAAVWPPPPWHCKLINKAAEDVRKLQTRPDDGSELRKPCGLNKQAIIGDINIEYPGMLDLKSKAKWEAWNLHKGLSKEDAMNVSISKAKELIEKQGAKNTVYEKIFRPVAVAHTCNPNTLVG